MKSSPLEKHSNLVMPDLAHITEHDLVHILVTLKCVFHPDAKVLKHRDSLFIADILFKNTPQILAAMRNKLYVNFSRQEQDISRLSHMYTQNDSLYSLQTTNSLIYLLSSKCCIVNKPWLLNDLIVSGLWLGPNSI